MPTLLTRQVTPQSQVPTSTTKHKEPLRLVEIVFQATTRFIHSSISPKLRSDVPVRDFINQDGTNKNNYYETFMQACYTCETFQDYMPHWTPPAKDNIVYTTIDEVLSRNIADIEA